MEILSDYHCKDKFLVQSVAVQDRATIKDFGPQLVPFLQAAVIEFIVVNFSSACVISHYCCDL